MGELRTDDVGHVRAHGGERARQRGAHPSRGFTSRAYQLVPDPEPAPPVAAMAVTRASGTAMVAIGVVMLAEQARP